MVRCFQIRGIDLRLGGAKDGLHVLERFSSCLSSSSKHSLVLKYAFIAYLFDNKPSVDHQGKVKNGEHQKCLPSEIFDSMGSDLGKDEVEKPLCGGTDGDTDLSSTVGENFACIQP